MVFFVLMEMLIERRAERRRAERRREHTVSTLEANITAPFKCDSFPPLSYERVSNFLYK